MCKGYTSPPIDRDGRHAQRVVDKLLKVEGALDNADTAYAVANMLTCGRAAAIVKEMIRRGLINLNPKDPTNG